MLGRLFARVQRITCRAEHSRLRYFRSMFFSTQAPEQAKESKAHLLLLFIPVTTFGLGTWQVFRRQWKLGLIRELEERTTGPPIDPPEKLQDLNTRELEYRRLRIRGKFDHSQEFHVSPRSLTGSSGGLGKKPKSGTHVITPFELSSTGDRILVNRGWVPRNKSSPDTRPEGQIQDEVEIVAFIRKNEPRAPFQPQNIPERNQWYYRDVENMAALSGCLPIQVDADAGSTVPGGPVGGQTRVTLRNEHLQYIITWYALSAATAYMYYRMRKPKNFLRP